MSYSLKFLKDCKNGKWFPKEFFIRKYTMLSSGNITLILHKLVVKKFLEQIIDDKRYQVIKQYKINPNVFNIHFILESFNDTNLQNILMELTDYRTKDYLIEELRLTPFKIDKSLHFLKKNKFIIIKKDYICEFKTRFQITNLGLQEIEGKKVQEVLKNEDLVITRIVSTE